LPCYEKKILFHQDHLAGRQETAGFEHSNIYNFSYLKGKRLKNRYVEIDIYLLFGIVLPFLLAQVLSVP